MESRGLDMVFHVVLFFFRVRLGFRVRFWGEGKGMNGKLRYNKCFSCVVKLPRSSMFCFIFW